MFHFAMKEKSSITIVKIYHVFVFIPNIILKLAVSGPSSQKLISCKIASCSTYTMVRTVKILFKSYFFAFIHNYSYQFNHSLVFEARQFDGTNPSASKFVWKINNFDLPLLALMRQQKKF